MKKTFFLFVLVTSSIFSQKGKIFIEANYNTFLHSKLSDFQTEFLQDLPKVPIAITDDFSGNIGFTVGYEIVKEQATIFLSYNTTGGKLSYADFSGVIRIEEPLSALTLGAMYHLHLNETKNFKVGFKAFTMFSDFEVNSYSKLNNKVQQESLGLRSIDLGIGVSFIYEYPISFFILRANLGFDAVLGGKLRFNKIDKAHLINKAKEEVNTGWTGLRTGFGIAIPIK